VRTISHLLLSILLLAATLPAQTKGIATFGGLKNLEFINQYYNGGNGSLGSGPGKDLHLEFTANAQAIVSGAKGGSGNFTGNPGGYPVMFFQTGKDVVVDIDLGATTGLWFTYSALQPGTFTLYDGAHGAGTVLASVTLTPNNVGCNTYKLCVWTPVGVPLTGMARSLRFSGTANYMAIGAIHFGVKLPTSITLASSQNPSAPGQGVTFTATVAATGTLPSGTVRFKIGNVVAGEVPLTGGAASLTLTTLPVGTAKITAIFRGDGFVTSTATLLQTVNP